MYDRRRYMARKAPTEPRRRNSRGQGDRLREEIIAAAIRLLSAAESPVSLRAVAKEARIAAPSVYLQFADLEALLVAVLERLFREQITLRDEAEAAAARLGGGSWERLVARSVASVRFGIEQPGHFKVLFEGRVFPKLTSPRIAGLGRPLLARTVELIEDIPSSTRVTNDPARLAMLLWAGLHGIVSLRINKPMPEWPDPAVLAEQMVRAIVQPTPPASRSRAPR